MRTRCEIAQASKRDKEASNSHNATISLVLNSCLLFNFKENP
nr:MAG TPA: hypothetical protein [Caudoviricetes sp.]